MKWLHKPTPTQSPMVFMTMMLSGFLVATTSAYLNWRYLGGKQDFIWISVMGCLGILLVLPRALRDIRMEVYRDATAGRVEPTTERRPENWNLWNSVSYVLMGVWACVAIYIYFFRAMIPLGAKMLLGIVLTMCVSLTLLNLRYAWISWQESRKIPLRTR